MKIFATESLYDIFIKVTNNLQKTYGSFNFES